MKKFIAVVFAGIIVTGIAFAQEFKVSGEIKTGFFWFDRERVREGKTYESQQAGWVHNSEDDAGQAALLTDPALVTSQGRFRMDMHLDNGNTGLKVRFEQLEWKAGGGFPRWAYAFAYGDFLSNQLKISIGRLGDSPWATGGPEMWKELDTQIGIRAEIKPKILPGLNIGFVINDLSDQQSQHYSEPQTLFDVLSESVLGISYTHDVFHGRLAYRLDSKFDEDAGDRLIYRLEERVLRNFIPGFQIWANGDWQGLRTDNPDNYLWLVNWLYVQYAPELFTAQLRLGYDAFSRRSIFYARPSFFLNLFNKFINIGASFEFGQDFGDNAFLKESDTSPLRIMVEPMIKVNFGTAYIAFVYQYRKEFLSPSYVDFTRNHIINLRVLYVF